MALHPFKKKFIGEILLEGGYVTKDQLKTAFEEQKKNGGRLGEVLITLGFVNEEILLEALAVRFSLPLIKLAGKQIDADVLKKIPEKIARHMMAIPFAVKDGYLSVAMADPTNVASIDELEALTGLKLSIYLASHKEIAEALERSYAAGLLVDEGKSDIASIETIAEDGGDVPTDEKDAVESAPIIKYVNSLFFDAVNRKASDIHLEPEEKSVNFRLRIDGDLRTFTPPPFKFYSAIVSRIKIIANLDIAERRLPQDGKCKMKIGNKKIDVRVSTLPTLYGEKVVMRILDRTNVSLQLSDIGFSEFELDLFKDSIQKPYGMILVTGPTGSGKTTTLYTGLNFINTPDRNIVTVEDPVEYELSKINQVQVKPVIGLTFAGALRSILRQDPDVILIGEIRDKETAEIAIQSALTGHLVLSTLHTNDAVSSISRLKYMGIEPFLIADAVDLIIAQRLVRRICPDCKTEQELPRSVLDKLHIPEGEKPVFYHGKGCERCSNTGYRGRTGINEMLPLSHTLKKMVIADANEAELKEVALKEGLRTLRQRAIDKALAGITTVEEVLANTNA